MKTFTSRLKKFDSDLWGFHFIVPKAYAEDYIDGTNRRVVCTLNGSLKFQCALMPLGDGNFFINVNKKNRHQLKLKVGSEVQVHLARDESRYGLPMPEEMKEVLHQDPLADELFHALTPGKQRTLLFIAGSVNDTDKRIRKAIIIANHLKLNKGKINFRQLNEEMKLKN